MRSVKSSRSVCSSSLVYKSLITRVPPLVLLGCRRGKPEHLHVPATHNGFPDFTLLQAAKTPLDQDQGASVQLTNLLVPADPKFPPAARAGALCHLTFTR